jgi:hypothetical protein
MLGRLECGLDKFTQTLGRFSSSVTGTVHLYGREVDQYVVKSATQKFELTTSGLPDKKTISVPVGTSQKVAKVEVNRTFDHSAEQWR